MPSPIQLGGNSEIGLAKAVSTLAEVDGQPGVFDFDLTYVVTNTGETLLTNVQVTDDLQDVLVDNPATDGADGFSVQSVTVDSFIGSGIAPTANVAYDGDVDQNLFSTAPNTLNVGDTATVTVTVRADLSSDGILDTQNSATATGEDPSGNLVMDVSQSGTNIDPDNNGDPTDNNVPTPITFDPDPSLVLIKRITTIFRQGLSLPVQGINDFNDQAGDADDTSFRDAFTVAGVANQPAGLFEFPPGFELQPNDEVEYTIYFWNNGTVNLPEVQICDELQPPSVLNVATGLEVSPVGPLVGGLNFVNAAGQIQGESPGSTLEDFCISAPGIFPFGPPGPSGGLGVGAGGGVTTNPFLVPINEFGAIRFRVRIP